MKRKRPDRLTVGVGELVRAHIRNRAKRLGITAAELVIRAVMRVTDRTLRRP